VLNEILQGQASLETPQKRDPYRAQDPVTFAECARCRQPFPSGHGNSAMCPACIEAEDAALQRALVAEGRRGRRNNLVFGTLLIALGVLVAVFTYGSGMWLFAFGPIVVGAGGLMRALVS
jgi:hypothetical protein